MKKMFIVLSREYFQRLRRPSFWILTLLVPILLAALYAVPVIAASSQNEQTEVLVVDETGLFENGLHPNDEVAFRKMPSLEYARRTMEEDKNIGAILFIPMRETTIPHDAFLYHRGSTPPLALQSLVDSQLQMLLRNAILEDVYHLEPSVYRSVESANIRLHAHDAATGKESFAQVKSVLAMVLTVLMVLALVVFGVQVMRGVREEKNSRVVEVVVSSVSPVMLLIGKIVGVALAAFTQLVLWVALTALFVGGVRATNPDLFAYAEQQMETPSLATKGVEATVQYNTPVVLPDEAVQGLAALNYGNVIVMFALFFLLGYLLYGALLAVCASKLDADADSLQWVLVSVVPMLLTLLLSSWVLQQPAGTLAMWLTIIPFTAPAAVMLRLPFGIGVWEVIFTVILMVATFVAMAFIAARLYRKNLLK